MRLDAGSYWKSSSARSSLVHSLCAPVGVVGVAGLVCVCVLVQSLLILTIEGKPKI